MDDGADHFLVEGRDGIDGYARLHVNKVPCSVRHYLRLEKILADPESKASYLSKVMLSSSRRGGLAFSSLTRFMYHHARQLHCNLFFCHANELLAHLYQGFGWRPYTELVAVPHMDPQMPLVLMPGDRHLLSISRPLLYDVEMTLKQAPKFWSNVHKEFGSLAVAPV